MSEFAVQTCITSNLAALVILLLKVISFSVMKVQEP